MTKFKTVEVGYTGEIEFSPFTVFVWCKGEHWKAYCFGWDEDDWTFGIGGDKISAVEDAIETWRWYEEHDS